MPFCEVRPQPYSSLDADGDDADGNSSSHIRIFYQLYGSGITKILFIAGFACTLEFWQPLILRLVGSDTPNSEFSSSDASEDECTGSSSEDNVSDKNAIEMNTGHNNHANGFQIQACAFDNRGVGRSSVPVYKSDYTTSIMAKDALALLDHLGWQKAHVCGHSMGGMIASKLAALAPHRIASLALISITGGGVQCFPKIDRRSLDIAFRFLRAKTVESRIAVDLDTHYTKDYLDAVLDDGVRRRDVLFKDYLRNMSARGMQPEWGFKGHIHACWKHRVTREDIEKKRSAGFPIAVVHGKGDVVAQIKHAKEVARRLRPTSRMFELPGGHLVTHQHSDEVFEAVIKLIRVASLEGQLNEWNNSHVVSKGRLPRTALVLQKMCCFSPSKHSRNLINEAKH